MTRTAYVTVFLALLAGAAEVGLAATTAPAWATDGPLPVLLGFLAGPMAFLALLAWRRRTHPARSRLLFWLTVVLAAAGVGVLAADFARFRAEEAGRHARHAHPVLVPLVQWAVVMLVWFGLVYREGREKRAKTSSELAADERRSDKMRFN
jgi:uncharacterized membrane protein